VEAVHPYLVLKTVHVLSALVFLGTGLGSAWYRLRADLSHDLRVIAWCQREVVLADWTFTIPAGVALPASAIALVIYEGIPWRTPWILWGVAGYLTAGVLWLPAAWLQIAMRRLALDALAKGLKSHACVEPEAHPAHGRDRAVQIRPHP